MAMLLLLSVMVLLTQPPRTRGAGVTTVSQKPLVDACTLAMCSPVENGLPGRDGRDGREDPRGEKGDPGSPGATGPMSMLDVPNVENGSAGELGPKGDSRPSGLRGPAGPPGPARREGPSGMQGDVGPQDAPGPKGEPGPKGKVGAPGVQGAVGPRGPLALKGEQGAPGERGAPGNAGPSGPAGPPGLQGARGPPGLKGDRGAPGCRGAKGESGLPDIAALRQQVEALQGQVGRLQGDFLQYKKVELFPNGRGIGQKVFKTAGFVKRFYEAQQVCIQAGGQLPSPRSAVEKEALQQLVEAEDKGPAFLSMTDYWTDGRFTYPGGAPLVYSNWAPGEPNNDSGREDCVEILTNGKWNDIPCGAKRLVICEF